MMRIFTQLEAETWRIQSPTRALPAKAFRLCRAPCNGRFSETYGSPAREDIRGPIPWAFRLLYVKLLGCFQWHPALKALRVIGRPCKGPASKIIQKPAEVWNSGGIHRAVQAKHLKTFKTCASPAYEDIQTHGMGFILSFSPY